MACPLRGLLNSGYRRGGSSSLCVGHGTRMAYRDFSTFAAKALAGIGGLPDTVRDRAIPIMLQRRLASESVERWRERDGRTEATPIADRLTTWARSVVQSLQTARPELPETLDDRAADVWEPLLAIADRAGADWPGRARQAAEALSGQGEDADPVVQLLQDIRDVLGRYDGAVIATSVLLEHLVGAEDRPWNEWRRGHPLTARGLACLLEPLGVQPDRCDTPTGRLRGYRRAAFRDAIARYLPSHASRCPETSKSVSFTSTRTTTLIRTPVKSVMRPMPRAGDTWTHDTGMSVPVAPATRFRTRFRPGLTLAAVTGSAWRWPPREPRGETFTPAAARCSRGGTVPISIVSVRLAGGRRSAGFGLNSPVKRSRWQGCRRADRLDQAACELVGVGRSGNWIAGGKVEYVRTASGSVRIFVDALRPRLEDTASSRSDSQGAGAAAP